MSGLYFLYGSILKNLKSFGLIWPDWGNAVRANLAGLGSILGMRVVLSRRVFP